jgi:hypothetical protein
MTLTVRARADAIATFRFTSVYLMETLARWVPTTPELEVKVLFGRHLWDFAQHADAFGRRTAELRLGPQVSRDPSAAFRTVLSDVATASDTASRVSGFYDRLLSQLESLYHDYLSRTDVLLDEPSVRILERTIADFGRLRRDADDVRRERKELGTSNSPAPRSGAAEATSLDAVVQFRPEPAGAEGA